MKQFIKNQYGGFKLDETLATNITFKTICNVRSKQKRKMYLDDDTEIDYYTIVDEFGARFSCFNMDSFDDIISHERYELSGWVKIGKGGTYLNVKSIEKFNQKSYTEETKGLARSLQI